MTALVLIFGLLTGTLLAALVGLIGSRRRIGFGWSFLLSLITTPLVGLVITLCFPSLPGKDRKWGCLSAFICFVVLLLALVLVLMLIPGCLDSVHSLYDSLLTI